MKRLLRKNKRMSVQAYCYAIPLCTFSCAQMCASAGGSEMYGVLHDSVYYAYIGSYG
jgi:hypothetical protein